MDWLFIQVAVSYALSSLLHAPARSLVPKRLLGWAPVSLLYCFLVGLFLVLLGHVSVLRF